MLLFLLITGGKSVQSQSGPDKGSPKLDSLLEKATRFRFSKPEQAKELSHRALELAKKKGQLRGRARAIELLGELNLFQNYPSLAKTRLKRADSLRTLMEDPTGKGKQRLETGLILLNKHKFLKADSLFKEAASYFEKAGRIEQLGRSHYFRAKAYYHKNLFPKALKEAHRALTLYDSIAAPEGKALAYRNIGEIHWAQENEDKAMEAYQEAANFFEKAGNDAGIASAKDLMGEYYLHKKKIDSARRCYSRALELRNGKGKQSAYSRANLARALFWKEKLDSSEQLAREALKVFERFRDPTGSIQTNRILGDIAQKRGQLDSALHYYRKALPKAKRIDDFGATAGLYRSIAKIYDRKGRGGKAYETLKKASTYEDSLALKEQKKKMAELTAKYDMRERKKELKLKEAQLKRNRLRLALVMGGLALVVLFSGFLYYQVRQKKKANTALVQKNHLIEEKNREILQSLRYASHIQSAVLPEEERIKENIGSGFVLFKPRDMVSGDLYWMEEEQGLFFFAVVDCTGHGVPGALISILGHNALNKAIKEEQLQDPADILSFLDQQLKQTLGKQNQGMELRDGMDIALCCYDPQKQELSFAGAVEPLYLLKKDADRIEEYKGDRQPVGGILSESEGKKLFTSQKFALQEGDRFYIFSDGYPDQFGGEKGKKLKYSKFRNIILETADVSDLREQRDALDKRFEKWRGEHEQVDDVLVIGARV